MSEQTATTLDRRQFIGYVGKGTGLAVALTVGVNPRQAEAGLLGGVGDVVETVTDPVFSIPETAEAVDLTDLLLLSGDPFYYDYRIEITSDNRVNFELPRMEVGQGIITAATMIVAEELDVRVDQIDPSLSPAEFRRSTGQITGGSHAVRSLWDPLRRVTAALRAVIVQAAAAEFGIAPGDITTSEGFASAPDGRSVPYRNLSNGVEGRNDVARTATPKDPSTYAIVGQPTTRLDARDIVTGKVEYAMDMDVIPGARPCVAVRPPTLGGNVASFDATAALALPGVIAIEQVDLGVEREMSGLAVVARSFGEAFRAKDLLQDPANGLVTWTAGVADDLSDDDIIAELRAINLPTLPDTPLLTNSVEGEFIFPYFAHAPLETMTAVADVRNGTATIYTGAKTPLAAQGKVARDLGLLPTDVTIHVIKTGGSFGRRLFFDAAVESARISEQLGMPVKYMYTRQDDTRFGRTRPLSLHNVKAGYTTGLLGDEVVSFDHRAATPELDLRHGFGDAISALGAEFFPYGYSQTIWHSTQLNQYRFGAVSLLLNETPFPLPTSSWRSIYSGTAVTSNEIIVDELARELGRDEYEFRMEMLDDGRQKAVLQKVATEGQWGRSLPDGVAQGLGVHHEYKSRAAFLVEIDTRGVEPRVTRMVAAVDVNTVVNPRGLEGQVISAATDAVSSILNTGLHFTNGAVEESAYSDFFVARMNQTPADFDIHIMPSNGETPGGAGELCLPAASAAIANAWARATGVKPRRFPITEFYAGA